MAKKRGGGGGGMNNMLANMPPQMVKQLMKQCMAQLGQQQGGGGGGAAQTETVEKIKGTRIEMRKGGEKVRVVQEDGKEFPITATKAVYKYLKSIGQEVSRPNPNQVKKKSKHDKPKKERTPEELEAYRQKMVEKNEAKIVAEGRVLVNNTYHPGEIVQRGGSFVWVKPLNATGIPAKIRSQLQTMNDEFRAKATGKNKFCGGIDENVVYVRLADISDLSAVPLKTGTQVQFKYYTDNKGVGGCEVIAA